MPIPCSRPVRPWVSILAKTRHGPVLVAPGLLITFRFKICPAQKKRLGISLAVLDNKIRQINLFTGLHFVRIVEAVARNHSAIELRDTVKIVVELRRLKRGGHSALPRLFVFRR